MHPIMYRYYWASTLAHTPSAPLCKNPHTALLTHALLRDAVQCKYIKDTLVLIPGPFNPTASLPTKLVKKILDLEFVEMADITTDEPPPNEPGRPPAPGRYPITNISQWVERFSMMAAVIELSGSPTTDVTAEMPWCAKISTGLCQTLGYITKPSQGGLGPSPDAHTAWTMTIMAATAQKTPTAPCWVISRPWAPGQCQPLLNPCQSPRLARLVAALTKGDVTSSSAANTSIFVRPAVDLTQSSNAPKGNHQAAADHLRAGALPHILATKPSTSKSSNNSSDLR